MTRIAPLIALCLCLLWTTDMMAQGASQDELRATIRQLDRAEAEALLRRDTTALRQIWAPDFTVNNPRNSITRGSEAVIAFIRNGSIDYSSFVRQVEEMLVRDDVVIVMGSESITPINSAPSAGQTIRRRYTHVWMQRDGRWRLTARHANVVAAP